MTVVAAIAVTFLAGCTATPPTILQTPGPTVTNTVVVTPTPAPLIAGSSLTQIQAWDVCWAAQSIGTTEASTRAWNDYSPSLVVASSTGGFTVTIYDGNTAKKEPKLYCTVKGTVGYPSVTSYPQFGE
jgi:hypothetical protein